jgi:hypothetical protein
VRVRFLPQTMLILDQGLECEFVQLETRMHIQINLSHMVCRSDETRGTVLPYEK